MHGPGAALTGLFLWSASRDLGRWALQDSGNAVPHSQL
jgi:hypothetical protein